MEIKTFSYLVSKKAMELMDAYDKAFKAGMIGDESFENVCIALGQVQQYVKGLRDGASEITEQLEKEK